MRWHDAGVFDSGRVVPFHVARDPVNVAAVRRWCDVMGAHNPVYTDAHEAAHSRFGGLVAPLAMLDVWTKPGLAYQRDSSDPQGAAFEQLDGEGFTSAVAVSSSLTQQRPLVPGDLVRSTMALESVSPEKSTALGSARFVTTRQDFLVDQEPVGHASFTVMKFRPQGDARVPAPDFVRDSARAAADDPAEDPAEEVRRDQLGTVLLDALVVGARIPSVVIPITTTLVLAGAVATSDYFDGHHDRDAAVRRGSQDIFMNIHTTLGLLEGCVGDWLGPNAAWHSMSARLGVPNYPGDKMAVEGEVASIDSHTGALTVDVRATNQLGLHASARVEVDLPI